MKSIKTKAILLSLSMIFVATMSLGLIFYYAYKNILVNEVNKAVERVATESADHLNNYIEQFLSPLVAISQDDRIRSMDFEQQKEVISSQINTFYLNIAVVNLEGKAHYFDGTVIDLSDRDYIMETFEGKISFSEVIVSRKTNTYVIMVAVPVYNKSNSLVGALIARLDVDFLSSFALSRGYGENGRAYIISDRGTFISRPEEEKSEDSFNVFSLASTDEKYSSFAQMVKESNAKSSGYGQYTFENKKILMGYASVNETNWKVYIGTYEEEALESLYGLRRMFAPLLFVTLSISVLSALIFISRFTKPIEELDNLFSQGAQGNLNIRFTPRTKDEIGRVGLSFNRMMDKIKTLTQYDPLTTLLNEHVLENDIKSLVSNDNWNDFSLIMIAIDKFSVINETYGYTTGDAILYEVAQRIASCNTEYCQVYRYKGDEFVVLFIDNLSDVEMDKKANNIFHALKEAYYIDGKTVEINVSIGIFTWNEATRALDPLSSVTQAVNYAKYLGSNQIQLFDQQINSKLKLSKELQADILNGLREDQFFLVYQPLFYLHSEDIAEVEALIRWNHPEKGLLYPDRFIELAEQTGLIVNIDQWVLETACKQLKSWKESKKPKVILSVNISSKTFEMKSFAPDLIAIVNKYDIDPKLLQLEITERMFIKNIEESIIKLNELRAMGIHVAIDDFGIGYSSLSYIIRLPIDSIKIDKSFIQNISSSKEAKTIVSTIINLCKTLNLNVIAEGIESRLELDYLKANQCDIGQGYYFSRPVSITEIESSLIKNTKSKKKKKKKK